MYTKASTPNPLYYYRYSGILVENYNDAPSDTQFEDNIQYCYKIGANEESVYKLNWSYNNKEYYDHSEGVTPNQTQNFVPTDWSKTIPSIPSHTNDNGFYLFRLKRVKHLGRRGLWKGDKEGVNFGYI